MKKTLAFGGIYAVTMAAVLLLWGFDSQKTIATTLISTLIILGISRTIGMIKQ